MLTFEHAMMPIKLCTSWQIWLDSVIATCFKRKNTYQKFLNVTIGTWPWVCLSIEGPFEKNTLLSVWRQWGRSLKHTIFHPTATSIRCCQAHGLCFLPFLYFLAKVERHLRMLDGYNRVAYCYHSPQVTLLTCGLMDDHNYFYILYGWKWRMGMKWTGYMCIPEAWTFGSRNEHKYWPRVLWVQGFHHFHIFYVLYCFVIFETASMQWLQVPWSEIDVCLLTRLWLYFQHCCAQLVNFEVSLPGGGVAVVGRLMAAAKICKESYWPFVIWLPFSPTNCGYHLKANKKLKPQVNISYDWRSALTESGVKCKVWFAKRYVWCIRRTGLDLRDLLLASSCHQRLAICQHFSC